jgi:type I restriction enzyme R subunit
VVFIFDECHRSQFGEAQKNLKKKFKKFCQFGFTGTPIFPENALGAETTASVFGRELHSYVITDAIRDEKVLKFKVDYNDVRPQFKAIETETGREEAERGGEQAGPAAPGSHPRDHPVHPEQLPAEDPPPACGQQGLQRHVCRQQRGCRQALLRVLRELQKNSDKPLRVATIFSFAANEEQDAIGDIQDESFDVSAMNSSAKEFLSAAIADYNALFKTNFSVDSNGFQNYYRDLAKQVKAKEIDLLIVVGMFLTGFDAPTLNTLFVDKNLRFHGLMQAYSRTNRIFDATKTFGNIVTFRDLEQATIDAITLFGDKNTKNVVLEKSYKEYMEGFTDAATGEARRGFMDVVQELEARFPDPAAIEKEADKKAFAKLFGEYLRVENVLQNYDEFASLKELQSVDLADPAAVEAFKAKHYLSDEDLTALQAITLPQSGTFRTTARPTTTCATGCAERKQEPKREVHHRLG